MASGGMRVIATLSPCHLVDGTVLLNLPNDRVQVVVAHLQGGQASNAVVVNKQRLSGLADGHSLYSVNLNEVMSGVIPKVGKQSTVNNINTILLWNSAARTINFNADNSLALNIVNQR